MSGWAVISDQLNGAMQGTSFHSAVTFIVADGDGTVTAASSSSSPSPSSFGRGRPPSLEVLWHSTGEHSFSSSTVSAIAATVANKETKSIAPASSSTLSTASSSKRSRSSDLSSAVSLPIPLLFSDITSASYVAEKKSWEAKVHSDVGDVAEPAPLNPEQRAIGRELIVALRELKADKYRDLPALVGDDGALLFLVIGAPGVGKSFLMGSMLPVMKTEDLGNGAFTAYTGVAAVQLPRPNGTCCSVLGISGNASSSKQDLPQISFDKIAEIEVK